MPLIHHNMTKWLILSLIMIVPIIPFYLLVETQNQLEDAFSSPATEYQFYDGDLPHGAWEDQALEWEYFDHSKFGTNKVTGTYWFKIQLPHNEWDNPHMVFYYLKNFELYLNDEYLYEWNRDKLSPYVERAHAHVIELPDDFAQKILYVRSDFYRAHLLPGHFFIDNKFNLVAQLAISSGYRIALGFVSLLIGLTGLLVYTRHREQSVLYFSIFSLYIVYMCLCRSWMFFGLFIPYAWVPYFQGVMLAVGGYFFLRFFEFIFGEGPYRIHRRLGQMMLIVMGVLVITAIVSPPIYHDMAKVMDNFIAPLVLVTIFISSIMIYRQKRDAESFWFMAGFTIFAIFTCFNFVQASLLQLVWQSAPSVAEIIRKSSALFYNNDRFMQTVFVLLFCMVMIVGERIRTLYFEAQKTSEELRAMSESLEQLVRERTMELEDTNVNLRASLQATSEALAANAVLEDRNRIARDMHDQVGHTLTAALFQIDAAKMLIGRDEQQAFDKMAASRESVNLGLESIRETVMKMKQDYESNDFITSLNKLIHNVQFSTGVLVTLEIDPDLAGDNGYATPLPLAIKKMVYHALQEGITNGIKHAKARRFTCTLHLENGNLTFRLMNDGDKYEDEPFGFGLKVMEERVEKLGGQLTVSDNDGAGCLLTIDVSIGSYRSGR